LKGRLAGKVLALSLEGMARRKIFGAVPWRDGSPENFWSCPLKGKRTGKFLEPSLQGTPFQQKMRAVSAGNDSATKNAGFRGKRAKREKK
jgi:hypothetical protein